MAVVAPVAVLLSRLLWLQFNLGGGGHGGHDGRGRGVCVDGRDYGGIYAAVVVVAGHEHLVTRVTPRASSTLSNRRRDPRNFKPFNHRSPPPFFVSIITCAGDVDDDQQGYRAALDSDRRHC